MGAKAKHDLAPIIRGAFANGIQKYCRKHGKSFSDVMVDWLEEDWKAVLNAVGKYTVREAHVTGAVKHKHDHQHTHEAVSATNSFIEGIITAGEEESSQKSLPN